MQHFDNKSAYDRIDKFAKVADIFKKINCMKYHNKGGGRGVRDGLAISNYVILSFKMPE